VEQFRDDGITPVWPHRQAERRGEHHREYIETLLQRLADLETSTRPNGGAETEKDKDIAAFSALECAADLVRAVAGWAIDHQIGLALEGLQFAPLQPSQTKAHPNYLSDKDAADSHRHEREGAAVLAGIGSARLANVDVRRRALRNLLRANPGAFPDQFCQELYEGLLSLEFGRPTEIVMPASMRSHHGLVQLKCKMMALEYIQYQVRSGRRAKKHVAQQEAADAFAISIDAVRKWKTELRKKLGDLEVARRLAITENLASHGHKWDSRFGQEFLDRAAKIYRKASRG
jgi:hypothetical protein